MDDVFKIYVEQLRDGHIEKIDEKLGAGFLDVQEKELSFEDPVLVKGEAYLAEENLILNLNAITQAIIPCAICNAPVKVEIEVKHLYHLEPLAEIKGSIFNFKELLREEILLALPGFTECEGRCPRRKEIAKYLAESEKEKASEEDEGYQPFADFDWDKTKKKK